MTSKQQGKPFSYDFGGPIGAFCTTLALPIVVLLLIHWTKVGFLDLGVFSVSGLELLLPTNTTNPTVLLKCTVGLVAWFLLLVVLWAVLPGSMVPGAPIGHNKNGDKDKNEFFTLAYKLNGHVTFWLVVAVVVCLGVRGALPLNDYLYRYYEALALMDIVLCFVLSAYLYLASFVPNGKILAQGGNSGNAAYDFWMGRELNPRWGLFDWKVFCELRPGLIGWTLLNAACLQEQYVVRGGSISGSMCLLNIFQAVYVWDALYQERAILTTMDVTTDGFGFMLVFGDLCWVPFTYSVPAKYLVHHDPELSNLWLALIVGLYLFGYFIFRGANGQKDIYRRNPNDPRVTHLSYLQTKRGTRLLTSGWWGMARKINYTGDYLMGLTYCVLCGVDSIVPYYYAIYFAVLLIHRSIRDDEMCHAKYGDDWIEYKRQVPYRFIPGIM
jgi:delta14-sterol reductase